MKLWTFGTELPEGVLRDACHLASVRLDQAITANDILPEEWTEERRQKVERALKLIVSALDRHRRRRRLTK